MATKGFLVGDHSIRPRRPVRYVATKQATKSNKRKKKKPEWDSTVNDLNVHKATKEEQIKRHQIHKSKNAARGNIQSHLKDQSLDSTTPDTVERRKLAIVQEVLYGHDTLQDVLSQSDKAMSVVKDLFGDDPKKFMGFPNITAAPSMHGKENRFVVGPVVEPPQTPTHLSLLSDSVMRTPALNELSDDKEELSPGTPTVNETKLPSSSFQPMLDLQRFQQYVTQEQSRYVENQSQPLQNGHGSDHMVPYGRGMDHVAPRGDTQAGLDQSRDNPDVYPEASQPYVHLQAAGPPSTDGKGNNSGFGAFSSEHVSEHVAAHGSMASEADHASEPSSFLSQKSAEIVAGGPNFMMPVTSGETTASSMIPPNTRPSSRNPEADQQASNRTRRSTKRNHKPTSNSSSSGLRSLDDLKKMVDELESEIAAYESETGRQQTGIPTVSDNFSGYTASLITAVTKLMSYLKESEIQRKAEMVMREQVLQGFEEQRVLVDALTNDILHSQEQCLALQRELLEYKNNTDEQLQYLKRELFVVLRSHEYQALSSSINTLYSLNPVTLKQGAFDILQPKQDECRNSEYLPGAPVSQAHQGTEQERITNGPRSDFTATPSFIPLASSQGQGIPQCSFMQRTDSASHGCAQVSQGRIQPMYIYDDAKNEPSSVPLGPSHRINGTIQQGTQASVKPLGSNRPIQQDVHVVASGNFNGRQHFEAAHDSGLARGQTFGMSGQGQIGSNILMYPPTQGPLTQVANKVMSQISTAGVPPVQTQTAQLSSIVGYSRSATSTAPHVRNEPTLPSTTVRQPAPFTVPLERDQPAKLSTVGNSATFTVLPLRNESTASTAPPVRREPAAHGITEGQPATFTTPSLYSPHHLAAQSASIAQMKDKVQPDQPALRTMRESTRIVSQGVPSPTDVSTRMSRTMPSGAATLQPCTTRQVHLVTQQETSNGLPQPQQQVQAQSSTKLEHAPKSRGFVPVSKITTSGLPAGHQLRERLQNLANRQKSLAAKTSDHNVGSAPALPQSKGDTRGVQQPRPTSPHVHFKDPPVAGKEEQTHSPPVSPIPYKNAAISRLSAPPDKRVVVNLPNAWSDVSSTISL